MFAHPTQAALLAILRKLYGLQGVSGAGQSLHKFCELPISQYTKGGLKEAKFMDLTAIQRYALPHVLGGRDVLGAAKTGSGKTLAFLIPVSVATAIHASATTTQATRLPAHLMQLFDKLYGLQNRHSACAGHREAIPPEVGAFGRPGSAGHPAHQGACPAGLQ